MRKTLNKTLAAALSLLMLLSCFSLCAGAVSQVGENGGYLVIGDSIGRGCGSEGFYLDKDGNPLPDGDEGGQYDEFEMRNVQGAYTTQVAEALGCIMPYDITDQSGNFWPLCYPGLTTAIMLDLLGVDDEFEDKKLNYSNYDWMLGYFGGEYSFDGFGDDDTKEAVKADSRFGALGMVGDVKSLIAKADLIDLELGMCDVFYRAYYIANGGLLADGLSIDFTDLDTVKEVAQIAIEEITFGFNYWKQWYPVLLKNIVTLNPDARIQLIGAFNLVNQMRITDSDAVPLGSVITAISSSMNKLYKEWADKYENVTYVDVSNTEPLVAEKDWSLLGDFIDNSFAGVHPSQFGHDYIARQILADLDGKTYNGTNIVVDLGRFTAVDYVMVDTRTVSDFTMDGTVITIPNKSMNAKTLTIAVKDDDNNIAIQTYTLSFSKDEGYTASRIYGTNDVVETVVKAGNPFFKWLKGIIDKIIDFFKGLF